MKALKQLLPPFLYQRLCRLKRRFLVPYKPHLCVIKAGPAEGLKLILDPEHSGEQSMMVDGNYDTQLLERIRELNLKEGIILDVGAHVGFYTLFFSRLCGNNGSVWSFEPNPYNFERLQKNIKENPDLSQKIQAHQLAVADIPGQLTMNCSINIDDGTSSGSHLDSTTPPTRCRPL